MNKIVFGITSDHVFAAANVLINLTKHGCKNFNEVVVFVADPYNLNSSELAALLELSTPELKVSVLDSSEIIPKFEDVPEELANFQKRYSSLTLLKAFIPALFLMDKFRNCSNILWMDCDMLPISSIDSILNFADENIVAACLGSLACNVLKSPELFPALSSTDIKPNGGLILWNKMTAKSIEDANQYIKRIQGYAAKLATSNNNYIDELSVLFAIKTLGAKFRLLPQIYNQLPDNYNPSTVIVHSIGGRRKFWNNEIVNLMFSQWEDANYIWLRKLMKVGVSYEDLEKFNKSKFKPGSRKRHIDGASWRTFWLIKCPQIKFQHPSVYFYPDVTTDTITFISLKNKDLKFNLTKESTCFVFHTSLPKEFRVSLDLLREKYEIKECEKVIRIQLTLPSQEKGDILSGKMTTFIDDINEKI